jgi:hypothetical protein
MSHRVESWRQAVFNDLLRGICLRSTLYLRPELRAPWGIRIARDCAVFHIVIGGRCWLEIKDNGSPVSLSAGISSSSREAAATICEAHLLHRLSISSNWPRSTDLTRIDSFALVEKGALTRLVCGGMQFENARGNPLLAVPPPLLHVRATEGRARPWLPLTVKHIVEGLDSGRPAPCKSSPGSRTSSSSKLYRLTSMRTRILPKLAGWRPFEMSKSAKPWHGFTAVLTDLGRSPLSPVVWASPDRQSPQDSRNWWESRPCSI